MRAISLGLLGGALAIYVAAAVWRFAVRANAPGEPPAPRVVNVSAYLALATLLVGLASLLFVMDPVLVAPRSYENTLATWWRGLPTVTIVSATATFAASALGTSRPAALAFTVSMPTTVFAAFVWVARTVLAGLVPPDDVAGLAELDRYGSPVLTVVTAFPAATFVAGFVAASLGRTMRQR